MSWIWIKELIHLLIKSVCSVISWVINKVKYLYPSYPYKTITITHVNREYSCYWQMSKHQKEDAMLIHGNFLVTNITDGKNIELTGALIDKKIKIRGTILVRGTSGVHSSEYTIAPHTVAEVEPVNYFV